ncbi:uncharacterized protein LOC108668604 [Hyalella azteca]|uniref:Uncharacterized protein LOC108668604 n=1 Tax=Hyalella azteca TaxID=294128 RepID=A0A8B7NCM1_HYAAZ|nr:uncharacterized protein LOC108668604 [Hyalella azteca]
MESRREGSNNPSAYSDDTAGLQGDVSRHAAMDLPQQQQAKLLEEQEERELWCAICLSVLRQPRQLPCKHAFCLHCLEKMLPKRGAVVRCPSCRRCAAVPSEGPCGLAVDPALLARVAEVRERRRQKARQKKSKTCSSCAEVQLCLQCPHCGAQLCRGCTARHSEALQQQVRSITKTLEKFKMKLQQENQGDRTRGRVKGHQSLAGDEEEMRRCRGTKRVLMTLKRALASSKTMAEEPPANLPAYDVPAGMSAGFKQLHSLNLQLMFLLKLTSTLESHLMSCNVVDIQRTKARQSAGLEIDDKADENMRVREEFLIDLRSDEHRSEDSRRSLQRDHKSLISGFQNLRLENEPVFERSSRSTPRYNDNINKRKSRNRARHVSYSLTRFSQDSELASPLRSHDGLRTYGNRANSDELQRSRSYSRCGSPSESSRSRSRTREENSGIFSGDEDDDKSFASSHQISSEQSLGCKLGINLPFSTVAISDPLQMLEDQSLLYRCKSSRSLQRLKHRSLIRRPTDVSWCPWNNTVYITVSQIAKVVMVSCASAGLGSTLLGVHGYDPGPQEDRIPTLLTEGRESRPRAWGERGDEPGHLLFPSAIACSPLVKELYVLDKRRCRVVVFSLQGHFLREFGSRGHGSNSFSSAEALAADHAGLLYIADTCNDRILVLDRHGAAVRQIGSAELRMPAGVAVSGNKLLVADTANHKCRVYHRTSGKLLATLGGRGSNQAQLESPECVAVDACGFFLVGDTGNNRIQVFRPNGNFVRYLGCRNGKAGELSMVTGLAVTPSLEVLAVDCCQHLVLVY